MGVVEEGAQTLAPLYQQSRLIRLGRKKREKRVALEMTIETLAEETDRWQESS
jgi:hypothetical protein